MKTKIYQTFLLLIAAISLSSCSDEPSQSGGFEGEPNYKYFLLSALGSWPNTVHYMTGTNDLYNGEMDLKREGDEVNTKGTYAYIVKNGFIYNYKMDQGIFKKFKFSMDKLVTVKEIPYSYIEDVSTHTWVDSKTLIVIGVTDGSRVLRYTVFDVDQMDILKQGEITGLEPFVDDFHFYEIGTSAYIKGEIFLQYTLRDSKWMLPTYYSLAKINYNDFKVVNTQNDLRSRGVGNGSPYFKTSFIKDNQSYYYMCTPREATGQKDAYLFRANFGENSFDANYSVNLSELVGGKTLLSVIDYIGDDKAMILYRDPSLGNQYNARYAVLDLNTKQIVRTLTELPGDEPYELGFFYEKRKVNIALNSTSKDGNYVWIYDVKSDKVERGMKIPDHISGFARFDKLYD